MAFEGCHCYTYAAESCNGTRVAAVEGVNESTLLAKHMSVTFARHNLDRETSSTHRVLSGSSGQALVAPVAVQPADFAALKHMQEVLLV